MLSKSLAILLAVALAIAAGTGCGSSSDNTSGSAASRSISPGQFVKQGDQICEQAQARRVAALRAFYAKKPSSSKSEAPVGTAAAEQLLLVVALPPLAEMVEQLAAVELPEGEEEAAEAMVDSFESAVKQSEADPSSALDVAHSPFVKPDQMAKAMGFKVCSET